jgi:hypothetical protein
MDGGMPGSVYFGRGSPMGGAEEAALLMQCWLEDEGMCVDFDFDSDAHSRIKKRGF